MIKANKLELYTSPEADVLEVEMRQIICQSNQPTGSLDPMESTDESW